MRKQLSGFVGLVFFASVAGVALKAAGAPPNVELLMPFVLAAGLFGGPLYGFSVGLAARAVYDAYQGWLGPWTLMTAPSYAFVGLLLGVVGLWWRRWGRVEMALLAAAGTVVYDVTTMLMFGALFGIPLPVLVAGQVPFTINHVLGNALFCFLLAPSIASVLQKYVFVDRFVVPQKTSG